MKCQFEIYRKRKSKMPGWVYYRCARCGFTDDSPPPPHTMHRSCPVPGLGDRVQYVLATIGIRERTWLRIKRWWHIATHQKKTVKCKCAERQEQLNALGWRLTQFWRREHRLFTVAIVGTTVVTWLTKWLFF